MDLTIKDGGPAFPLEVRSDYVGFENRQLPGMSLRDYFAAQALPSVLVAADEQRGMTFDKWAAKCAKASYDISDAMLAERAK